MPYDKKIIAKARAATPARVDEPIAALPPVWVAFGPLPLFVELATDDLAVAPLAPPLALGKAVATAA